MMNTITATNGRAMAPVWQASSHLKRVGWMGYLVAAYPNAKTHETTYDVLEDQFQGVPGDVLFEAARLYVREGSKWFPSAFEFRPLVERVQAEVELNQMATRWQATVDSWPELRARRTAALEMWYADEIDDRKLLILAGEMESAGLLSAAAGLRGKVTRQCANNQG